MNDPGIIKPATDQEEAYPSEDGYADQDAGTDADAIGDLQPPIYDLTVLEILLALLKTWIVTSLAGGIIVGSVTTIVISVAEHGDVVALVAMWPKLCFALVVLGLMVLFPITVLAALPVALFSNRMPKRLLVLTGALTGLAIAAIVVPWQDIAAFGLPYGLLYSLTFCSVRHSMYIRRHGESLTGT